MERWISFDCFGTLIDWHSGFTRVFRAIAGERAADLEAAYHRHEPVVEGLAYRPYRDVTAQTIERAAGEIGLELSPGASARLAAGWGSLQRFPDTRPALERLRRDGWRLAVLTNCDDAMFEETKRELAVPLDRVVTAEMVRSYKPATAHFERFRAEIGAAPWVHAACSWFHDIAPARELGIPRIWIDRDRTGDDPAAATEILPDLDLLPETAESLFSGS